MLVVCVVWCCCSVACIATLGVVWCLMFLLGFGFIVWALLFAFPFGELLGLLVGDAVVCFSCWYWLDCDCSLRC